MSAYSYLSTYIISNSHNGSRTGARFAGELTWQSVLYIQDLVFPQAEKIASDGHVLSEGITDRPHFNIDNYRKINKSLQEIIGLARINLENITKVHKAAVTQIPENPRDPVPDVPRETGKRKAARPVRLIEDHPPSVNHRTAHNASSRVSRARTNPSKDTTRMLPVSGRQNLRLPKTPDFMVQQYVPERMRSRYNELRSNVLGQLQGVPEERRSVTEESMLKIVHELGAPPAIWQLRIACSLARHPIASPPTIDSDTTTAKALASQLDRLSQHTGRWAYLKCLYQYRLHQAFVQLNGNAHPQSQRRSGRQNYPSTQVMMQAAYPDITEERPWEWHLACRRLQEHKFHGRRLAKLVEHYQSEGIIMLLGANRWR